MPAHSELPEDLDRRLLAYAESSWNGYEAVRRFAQFTALIPAYAANLASIYGPGGLGDARRMWGTAADLLSAMTGMRPTLESLIEVGCTRAVEVDHIVESIRREFQLSGSIILRRLDFAHAALGDITVVLRNAVTQDTLAKPLLEHFRAELKAYDEEAAASGLPGSSFRRLLGEISATPDDFPSWDGRPMFLDEQRALLEYLAKSIGAEIVSHSLVDEPLGEYLLRASGVLVQSEVTGEPVVDINAVPHRLLNRPVEDLCYQLGNTVLGALQVFDPKADALDRLYVVEMAVRTDMDIDISGALASTRQLLVERALDELNGSVIDVTEGAIKRRARKLYSEVTRFEFPDLSSD